VFHGSSDSMINGLEKVQKRAILTVKRTPGMCQICSFAIENSGLHDLCA